MFLHELFDPEDEQHIKGKQKEKKKNKVEEEEEAVIRQQHGEKN